ncbi:TPA: PTS sugar transporter subunit IIB [Streptococcus suis]|uniref:PTS sugar transporter subunit IIB n=1 Tax=Streptococcus iners TaxID=3028084 RepID=A0AA96VMP4_9STRE|nr:MULTISPECIES: PTS sugar transporter subunit IIB [Streptococcus]HEM3194682.1 PTS sugar transporter subunit IIB [Streptococcus suis 10581]MCK3958168.1 PTS sugar transporter subunit IIB [Streptococcus suis]MCK4026436.1 PTS sugar transporter subunit IIB [Streptococcus suis]MDN2948024.1 PTS sugar transporter subunit IIB [Streptococcus suis]MDW8742794.1 PTS sugar transporter subunit IIB [Streptococcus suis]
MINILLCCSAGMSTSLLVTKMQKAADSRGLESTIWAVSADEAGQNVGKADVILLGPQIKFLRGDIESLAGDKPLDVIPMRDYGMLNGEAVLDLALSLYQS